MIDQEFEDLKKRLPMLRSEPPLPGDFRLEGVGAAPAEGAVNTDALRAAAISALKTVYDPEIPLNIYDLGLIYQIDVDETGAVRVQMTLTAPGCPVAGALVHEVHEKLRSVPGVRHATTELVWDPPWTRERMSEAARLELGLM